MIKAYTKIDAKLAAFEIDTDYSQVAIKMVRDHLKLKHKEPIFAVVNGGKNSDLNPVSI